MVPTSFPLSLSASNSDAQLSERTVLMKHYSLNDSNVTIAYATTNVMAGAPFKATFALMKTLFFDQ